MMSFQATATSQSKSPSVRTDKDAPGKSRSLREERRDAVERLGKRNHDPKPETILKEYELLRSEITTSLQIQQQILGFGIATIGLLAGAAFVGKNEQFRSQLLVVFLPLVSYLAVTIWFSEVMRMLRAGGYQLTLEKKLDDECEDGSLQWEYQVARGRSRADKKSFFGALDPDRLRWLAVTLLFLTLAVAAIMLGWANATVYAHAFAIVAGVVAAIVLSSLYGARMRELDDLLGVDRQAHSKRLIRFVEKWRRAGKARANLKASILRSTTSRRESSPAVPGAPAVAETN
jgi:hypothetical protein